MVLVILTGSLTKAVLAQVMDYHTSAEVWGTLHELFAARSSTQIVHTRLQLASLKKGAETVTKYFNKAKNLVVLIAGVGHSISDEEFSTFLLVGLGADYDSVVTSLSTQPFLPNSTLILSYLLIHESWLSHQTKTLENSISVNHTVTENKPEANNTSNRE